MPGCQCSLRPPSLTLPLKSQRLTPPSQQAPSDEQNVCCTLQRLREVGSTRVIINKRRYPCLVSQLCQSSDPGLGSTPSGVNAGTTPRKPQFRCSLAPSGLDLGGVGEGGRQTSPTLGAACSLRSAGYQSLLHWGPRSEHVPDLEKQLLKAAEGGAPVSSWMMPRATRGGTSYCCDKQQVVDKREKGIRVA